jgi:hypothetical protein
VKQTIAGLLERVRAVGGDVELRGGSPWLRAPAPLPDDLIAALRARKAEVVAVLSGGEPMSVHYTMDEILAEVESGCHACGGRDWWTDARWGGRVCRICDPPNRDVER